MKLIEVYQENLIECDNHLCNYVVKNETGNINIDSEEYIDMPCPNCGENLLTYQDYKDYKKFVNLIKWTNKWLGWLSVFFGTETVGKRVDINVHDGIHIKEHQP